MRIGFIAGCFDMGAHAGHVEFIKFAKSVCDHLIVGLHVNPKIERPNKNEPLYPLHQRHIILTSNKYIDEIIPYETEKDLVEILLLKNVNVRILGSDYKGKEFTGKFDHIETVFFERRHNVSSSGIRSKLGEF